MLYYRQHLHIRITKNDNGPQQIFCRMAIMTTEPLSEADMKQAAQTAAETLVLDHYLFTALQLAQILSEQNPDWNICLPSPGCLVDVRFASGCNTHTVTVTCGD